MNESKYISDSYISIILRISSVLFIITLSLFTFFLFKNNFFNPNFTGDESKYLSDLLNANQFGLGKAISDGASVTYLVLSYYLNTLLTAPLLSLKITSLISGILMFLFLYLFNSEYLNIDKPLKQPLFLWIIYLFVIQTTFFTGVNDILLDLFGTLFFITFFTRLRNSILKVIILGLFIALTLATRKMAVTYIFTFLMVFLLVSISTKNHEIFNLKNGLIISISSSLFLILLNIYPLINYNKFSFDDKILKGDVNWAQWDYHNALLIDKGVQNRFTHVKINETAKYIQKNGENSLPSSFFEMIYFDPLFTFKEFFIDFLIGLKYIFRQTGLFVLPFTIFLIIRIRRIFHTKSITSTDFIYLFSISYLFLISYIVIANIQSRWFMFFLPIMMLLVCKDLTRLNLQNKKLFIIGNHLLLSIMCFPYLFDKISLYF